MPLDPVLHLTDEEVESDHDDGEADGLLPSIWRRKRNGKQRAQDTDPDADLEQNLKALLGRKCVSCKHGCFQKFSSAAKLQSLREFKKDWTSLHKLDQDQVAPRRASLRNCLGIWGGLGCIVFQSCYSIPLYRLGEVRVLIFHLDWPVKKDPHKSGFPPSKPAFQAGRTGLVGVFFWRPTQEENYKVRVAHVERLFKGF